MSELSLYERLEALAAFVPVLEAPDFSFGEWQNAPGQLPWFNLSTEAMRFVTTVARSDWIVPDFNWPEWQHTDRARQLLEKLDAIADATVEDLEHLLTTHIRADRFIEGHLASAFDTGQLTAITRRASALMKQIENTQ